MFSTQKFKTYLYNFYNLIKRLKKMLTLFSKNNEQIFRDYYETNKWGDKESFSGEGSSIKNTINSRKTIKAIIKNYKIKSIFDVPCGDFNWMKLIDLEKCYYIGGDIVSVLIDKNSRKFSNKKINFKVFNMINSIPPMVDLILCRDGLIHLSNKNCLKVLKNFKKSKSKFLLTTHFPNEKKNLFIVDGMFRRINLQKKPFNLPNPIEIFEESMTINVKENRKKKFLALWKINEISF